MPNCTLRRRYRAQWEAVLALVAELAERQMLQALFGPQAVQTARERIRKTHPNIPEPEVVLTARRLATMWVQRFPPEQRTRGYESCRMCASSCVYPQAEQRDETDWGQNPADFSTSGGTAPVASIGTEDKKRARKGVRALVMVEPRGIEPLTFALRTRRSPS